MIEFSVCRYHGRSGPLDPYIFEAESPGGFGWSVEVPACVFDGLVEGGIVAQILHLCSHLARKVREEEAKWEEEKIRLRRLSEAATNALACARAAVEADPHVQEIRACHPGHIAFELYVRVGPNGEIYKKEKF